MRLMQNRGLLPVAVVIMLLGTAWFGALGQQRHQTTEKQTREHRSGRNVPELHTLEKPVIRRDRPTGTDPEPPRIITITPNPGSSVVDNVGISEVQIGFTEEVIVLAGAIDVWTVGGGTVGGFGLFYDNASNILTITFSLPIRDDRLTLVVDYSVVDLAGNELDGEILDPANAVLPSGDGVRGGQAVFRFDVLQGDADRNGVVDTADANVILSSLGRCSGEVGFDVNADLNRDGCVNSLDVGTFTLAEGRSLPPVGLPPAVLQVMPDPNDSSQIVITFNAAIDPVRFTERTCYLTDNAGGLLIPVSASMALDGLSASYRFASALASCTDYSVNVSNSLTGTTGALLVSLATPPRIGIIPPAPVLDPHTQITNDEVVTITGTAQQGSDVEVFGPEGLLIVPVVGDSFSADVLLSPNQANHLTFTAISSCDGSRSAPVTTRVTQDGEAPSLFVDFPSDGAEITTATTDVAGRVGDLLSGFMGLTVTVNGVPAIVDVGIGNNGTFFAPSVPLTVAEPTLISVSATDELGNLTNRAITVTHVEIEPGTPRMVVVSGNRQEAPIQTVLVDPILVRVTKGDGTPFANKIVTFDVTRSNGRLATSPADLTPTPEDIDPGNLMLQVRTDAAGNAQAYWRLGSDAGCGNNRVEVRSTSIAGSAFVCASATPGLAAQINVGSGNNQRAEVGGLTPEPLRVWVNDACNGIPGVSVTFKVLEGGGAVDGFNEFTAVTSDTGHAEVDLTLGLSPGGNLIEADYAGNPGLPATFVATALVRQEGHATTFSGSILDNGRRPVQGARCTLTVGSEVLRSVDSDIDGRFRFENVPGSGAAHLDVDGLVAFHVGGEEGVDVAPGTYPALAYETTVIPDADNALPTPVLLPELNPNNARVFDNTQDIELTVEGIDGLKMIVKVGSMTRADGSVPSPADPAIITLNQVHHDDVPMPMPDGAAPPFAWTLQPAGATFDPPVQIVYPNMTGLPPGSVTYFLSFNHDTNKFEIVATGHVLDDGSCSVSDPGSGITHAGWGCQCPPYPPTGDCEGDDDDDDPSPCTDDECEKPTADRPPAAPDDEDDCPKKDDEDDPVDPVYLFSGEFYEEVEDLRIRGRGLDFKWARKYRSKIGPNTAQGNGWDCSYNIFLVPEASDDIAVCDGNSRRDIYTLQPDGTWSARGFFRELIQNVDETYSLVFEDTGRWDFFGFDGSPQAGKIKSIVDRNNNAQTFTYTEGLLTTITDTLDRDIQIDYNPDGFIASITDFIGRQVKYEYYQNGDSGGSFGDLKSVTTPAVTGLANGNNFPDGKTTVYTYSKGFADDRLNHNLLTITDPKGQLYLTNIFSNATSPDDLLFDRIVRQYWGNQDPDTGDIVDLVYVPEFPQKSNGFAIVRVILNDRVGNVKEYFYDSLNRAVIAREFTGRADPDQPTTATTNRPTAQLRPDDPPFFETRYEWNSAYLQTRVTHPDGNVTRNFYASDLDPGGSPRAGANLRASVRTKGDHANAGDQESLATVSEYDTDFNAGGCCGFNFATKQTDARDNLSFHEYDDRGNRIRTVHRIPSIVEDWEHNQFGQVTAHVLPDNGSGHRRRDEYTYYASGPQRGYLQTQVIDVGGFALTTTYDYDAVGNVTRVTDPRGNDSLYEYNALDQLWRRQSREVALPAGSVRYERLTFFDANDNVVRVDIQNVDDQGTLLPNSHFTTVFEYEILNNSVRTCQEVGNYTGSIPGATELPVCEGLPQGDFITTESVYDENRNPTLARFGEAVELRQPTNVTRTLYDERDLRFRAVRAEGDADQSTTQFDYDGNQNLVRAIQGIEGTFPRVTTSTYDLYDRLVSTTDPMGNVLSYGYDANHNIARRLLEGQVLDIEGSAGNVRLSDVTYGYDAMDRLIRTEVAFFDTDTQAPLQGGQRLGKSITTTDWSDNSQVIRVVNDNLHQTLNAYDTANRRAVVTDHVSNTMTYTYDQNSNVTSTLDVEKSDLGKPEEVFATTYAYDALDRLVTTTDNYQNTEPGAIGNTHTVGYDSRNNRTVMTDALNHETRRVYDGINRLTQTIGDLDDDGADGDGPDISTTQTWDDTSRRTARGDDNGNVTTYQYDSLNRMTAEVSADSTVHSYVFDVHHNRTSTTDANGSVCSLTFDLLNRLTNKNITPGVGVSDDISFEIHTYDGLSRRIHAEDDDSVVARSYDSLSRVTREMLNGQTTTCLFDGVGNEVSSTYPGGRVIECTYDELERKKTITDTTGGGSSIVANYAYVGRGRVERREYGNGTRTDYAYDGITGVLNPANDFGVKRIIGTTHSVIANGTILDDRTFTWDRLSNKVQRVDIRAGGPQLTHDYTYDDIYRLVQTVVTGPSAVILRDTDYDFDGVGNLMTVAGAPDTGPHVGSYTMDPTKPEPADRHMNQYTTTPIDDRGYDRNGNLTLRTAPEAGATQAQIKYDYRNQMVEYTDLVAGQRHSYAYDALGRRIRRIVDADAPIPQETRYFYDDWRVCEEQDPAGTTQATYVYGLYLDEVLTMQRGGTDSYYHTDDLYNVMAVTDSAAAVVERYEYGDYGQPIDPTTLAPIPGDPSTVGNPYLFTGRRYDPETAWYYYRTRYLDPIVRRFTTRDTIGIWGDRKNTGNGYSLKGNNPFTHLDPLGLATYIVNRNLGASEDNAEPSILYYAPTHSFVVTTQDITDADGNIIGVAVTTYSWGNDDPDDPVSRWSKNRPEDRAAAVLALADGIAEFIAHENLDPFIEDAYDDFLIEEIGDHWNGWVFANCKTESRNLIEAAGTLLDIHNGLMKLKSRNKSSSTVPKCKCHNADGSKN